MKIFFWWVMVVVVFCVLASSGHASSWSDVVASRVQCADENPSCTCSIMGSYPTYSVNKKCDGTGSKTQAIIYGYGSTSGAGLTLYNCDGTGAATYHSEETTGYGVGYHCYRTMTIDCQGNQGFGECSYVSEAVFLSDFLCRISPEQDVNGGCSTVESMYALFTVTDCDHPPLTSPSTGVFVYTAANCNCTPSGLVYTGPGTGGYIGAVCPGGCDFRTCIFSAYQNPPQNSIGSINPSLTGVFGGQSVGNSYSQGFDGVTYAVTHNSDGTWTYTTSSGGVSFTDVCSPDLQTCAGTMTNPSSGESTHSGVNGDGNPYTVTTDVTTGQTTTSTINPDGSTVTTTTTGTGSSTTTVTTSDGSHSSTTSSTRTTSSSSSTGSGGVVTTVTTDATSTSGGHGGSTTVTTIKSDGTSTESETDGVSWTYPPDAKYDGTIHSEETPSALNIQSLISGFISSNPIISTLKGSGLDVTVGSCSVVMGQYYGKDMVLDFCFMQEALAAIGVIMLAAGTLLNLMWLFSRG